MKKELISVIMAAYNAENTIEKAVLSIINQTYSKWELIVVDDCSTDNTLCVVRALAENEPRIHLYKNKKNRGGYHIQGKRL